VGKDIKKKERSEKDSEVNPEEKKKRKLKPVHWVIIVMALALAGTITYFLWLDSEEVIEDRGTAMGGRGMIATPENIDEIRRLLEEEPSPDAQYTVHMTTNWEFETARTPSRNALVRNLEENSRTVYFDVTLNDTGALVYSSPYIPLGGMLEKFALDVNLSAGVHAATIRFFLVDDDNEVIADVADSVTLTILG
jgi:hypothetical protein